LAMYGSNPSSDLRVPASSFPLFLSMRPERLLPQDENCIYIYNIHNIYIYIYKL
jgi:hypothetical protein